MHLSSLHAQNTDNILSSVANKTSHFERTRIFTLTSSLNFRISSLILKLGMTVSMIHHDGQNSRYDLMVPNCMWSWKCPHCPLQLKVSTVKLKLQSCSRCTYRVSSTASFSVSSQAPPEVHGIVNNALLLLSS